MNRLLLAIVLAIGVLSGLVKEGTYASFTSTVSGADNQFTAGTVTLSAAEQTSGALTLSSLIPGSTSTVQVNVQNSGNVTLRYSLSLSATGNATLASTLLLTIWLKDTDACATPSGDEQTLSSSGALSSAGFGSSATGGQTGDRELSPSSIENLCFKVVLPSTAPTSLQNSSTTVTYTFTSEQVAGT